MRNILLGALITGSIFSISYPASAQAGQLEAAVAEAGELSPEEADKAVDAVFEAIRDELKAGREVQIRRFGTFYLQHRKARLGRNPRTGEELQIPARSYPRFRSSDVLKEAIRAQES